MSFYPEQLKSFDYYEQKLPQYLKSSESFKEHFRIWHEFLVGNEDNGLLYNEQVLLAALNIFDKDYASNFLENESSDMLDKLAALFAVKRMLDVTYLDDTSQPQTKKLSLTNEELLLLIKSRIIQSNCEGSYEQIQEFYKGIGLDVVIHTRSSSADEPAVCTMALIVPSEGSEEEGPSENIKALFFSGLLTIKSMGIRYIFTTIYGSREEIIYLEWDNPDVGWNMGAWR